MRPSYSFLATCVYGALAVTNSVVFLPLAIGQNIRSVRYAAAYWFGFVLVCVVGHYLLSMAYKADQKSATKQAIATATSIALAVPMDETEAK